MGAREGRCHTDSDFTDGLYKTGLKSEIGAEIVDPLEVCGALIR